MDPHEMLHNIIETQKKADIEEVLRRAPISEVYSKYFDLYPILKGIIGCYSKYRKAHIFVARGDASDEELDLLVEFHEGTDNTDSLNFAIVQEVFRNDHEMHIFAAMISRIYNVHKVKVYTPTKIHVYNSAPTFNRTFNIKRRRKVDMPEFVSVGTQVYKEFQNGSRI